ncbi:MAG: ArnT family glycosyltransferase [Nitrospinales bacterium]
MNKNLVPIVLYLILFAYFYSFSEYGFNIWDEGGFAYGTLRTYNGQIPMRDFNPIGYLPGRYFYGALFFKLFGVNLQSLRLGVVLFTPAMILMVYAAARKTMPQGFAFLAALGVLSAPSMYYNRFYMFFCVLIMYCLIGLIERKTASRYFLLFGAIVLCSFFKPEVALFGFAISAALVAVMFFQDELAPPKKSGLRSVKGGRSFWVPALASAGILGALTVYAVQQGVAEKLFNIVLETRRVWGNPFPAIFPFFKLLRGLGPHEMFQRVLFYLPILVYFAVTAILIVRLVRARFRVSAENQRLLVIVSFGVCAFGLVIWRAGFDNLLRTLAPFYILFCYLLFLIWGKLRDSRFFKTAGESASVSWIKQTGLNVFIVALPFLFYYEMNARHGFYAGSVGAVAQEKFFLRLNRMEVYTHPVEAKWLKEIVSWIQNHSRKGDPILALPLNPIFYYLTDRVNPTPHDWILPGMLNKTEQEKVVAQLEANRPKVIVYADIAIDGREERRFSNYAPVIFSFIAANYRLRERIGFFQILLPKETE